jgi:hypothetical protein
MMGCWLSKLVFFSTEGVGEITDSAGCDQEDPQPVGDDRGLGTAHRILQISSRYHLFFFSEGYA